MLKGWKGRPNYRIREKDEQRSTRTGTEKPLEEDTPKQKAKAEAGGPDFERFQRLLECACVCV